MIVSASDVFNEGGITVPGKGRVSDGDFEVTCDKCRYVGTLATLVQSPAEHLADVNEYHCPMCKTTLVAVGHWGLHEQPLQWSRYRIGDYAVECRVTMHIVLPNGNRVAVPSDPPV